MYTNVGTSMEVKIRNVRLEDLPKVYDIELKSFKHPYPYTLILTYYYIAHPYFLVAEINGKVVGYVIALLRGGALGHIISVAVDPKYRGRGIGKSLLKAIEELLRDSGAKVIRLEVSEDNEVAINLYRKLNYEIVDRIEKYYPDGSNAYVMMKRLVSEN